MATLIEGLLPPNLNQLVTSSKVLVVGAGGIGCELLKNLVLTGFGDIHIIDLDTIEVSNLNRQFLFRREHVGKPKALVAKESALGFNPNVNITAYHDSITESKYDVNFYSQFSLVMNALDNRAARSHVNRMCLAAKMPLLESGSAGYNGHVTLHLKSVSECFDCTLRPHQKTFPGCTIRNTPSEPIHCIVWAKHLFSQLFGIADPDEDVSPDSGDPEAVGDAGKLALANEATEHGNTSKVSTRQWASDVDYDARKLFRKFFNDDIKYLLSMENLWSKRRPPTPLDWENLPDAVPSSSTSVNKTVLKDQRVWSMAECAEVFEQSCKILKEQLKNAKEGHLIWDKDDDPGMDFVTACSNIRCFIFGIEQKSRFDTKSMAGNIIPAIAATNAIVAGLIVMHAFRVLMQLYHKCCTLFVSNRTNVRGELFAIDALTAPNPKCYVCTEKPELVVKIDVSRMTVRALGERVLKKELNMVAPDVEIDDGLGTILISSEEGETDDIADKLLKDFNVKEGTRLKCDDFLQNYQLNITIVEMKVEETEREQAEAFQVIGDRSKLAPKEEEKKKNGFNENGAGTSKAMNKAHVSVVEDEEDDDLMVIEQVHDETEEDVSFVGSSPSKGKRPLPELVSMPHAKKRRVDHQKSGHDGLAKIMEEEIELVDLD